MKRSKSRSRATSLVLIAIGCVGLFIFGVRYYFAGDNDLQTHELEVAKRMESFRAKIKEEIGPYLLHNEFKDELDITLDGDKKES